MRNESGSVSEMDLILCLLKKNYRKGILEQNSKAPPFPCLMRSRLTLPAREKPVFPPQRRGFRALLTLTDAGIVIPLWRRHGGTYQGLGGWWVGV